MITLFFIGCMSCSEKEEDSAVVAPTPEETAVEETAVPVEEPEDTSSVEEQPQDTSAQDTSEVE